MKNYLQYWNPARLKTEFENYFYLTSSNQSVMKKMKPNDTIWIIISKSNSLSMYLVGKIEISKIAHSQSEAQGILDEEYYPYLKTIQNIVHGNCDYDLDILKMKYYAFAKKSSIEKIKLENLIDVSQILRDELFNGKDFTKPSFQAIRKLEDYPSISIRFTDVYNSRLEQRTFA